MGADCKSVGLRLHRFESCTCHTTGQAPFRGGLTALEPAKLIRRLVRLESREGNVNTSKPVGSRPPITTPDRDDFYTVPAGLDEVAPGTVLRSRPVQLA